MLAHTHARAAILGLAPLLLIACGKSEPPGTTPGPEIDYVQATCVAAPVEHAADCPAPCAIDLDMEVSCDDADFAVFGLLVAPAPDATWLLSSSRKDRMLLAIDAAGATRVGDEVLPKELLAKRLFLGLAPSGKLHVAGDTRVEVRSGTIQHFVQEGGGWTQTTAFAPGDGEWSSASALDVDGDGVPHIWFATSGPAYRHTAEDPAGGWSDTAVTIPQGGWPQFALTVGGQPASFAVVNGADGGWTLHGFVNGEERSVGSPFPWNVTPSYTLAEGPPLDAGPPFAVALRQEVLRVAWPEGAASKEIPLPDAKTLVTKCNGGGECGTSCHEVESGLQRGAMAVARTDDGTLWVAYVFTKLDVVLRYDNCHTECGCDHPEWGCPCVATIESDKGTEDLHVVRVTADGSPGEVLSVPIARFAVESVYDDTLPGIGFKALDARGFGKQLAIGVRTTKDLHTPTGVVAQVRVLRIDTSKLPP